MINSRDMRTWDDVSLARGFISLCNDGPQRRGMTQEAFDRRVQEYAAAIHERRGDTAVVPWAEAVARRATS